MLSHFGQAEYELRCEWGAEGLQALRPACDAVVVVDVLSFSTAVDIAVSNGAFVLPFPWVPRPERNDVAERFASSKGALLAGERGAHGYTLSPASLRSIPSGTVLVLPSANGSAIAVGAAGVPTFTACLRNAPSVAARVRRCGPRIAVIPAGERWSGNSLRPCVEDLIGAGAVLANLPGTLSPEAAMAVAVFTRFQAALGETLFRCGSGKELAQRGFATDVELAAEYGVSLVAPVLEDGRFVNGITDAG